MKSVNYSFTSLSRVKTSILGILSCAWRPSRSLLLSLRASIIFLLSIISNKREVGGGDGFTIGIRGFGFPWVWSQKLVPGPEEEG